MGYFLKKRRTRGIKPQGKRGANGNNGAIAGTAEALDSNGNPILDANGNPVMHGVMLLPVKINFAKPHDATWAELPEKEVLLFEDETHIDVKIPMALTSLTQVMAIPELSKIHLTTNVTKSAGVDLPAVATMLALLMYQSRRISTGI